MVAAKWQPMDTAPKDGTEVLAVCGGSPTIAWYSEQEDDGPEHMGMDAGWWDALMGAMPGRSFGAEDSRHNPVLQPTAWMPMPTVSEELIFNED